MENRLPILQRFRQTIKYTELHTEFSVAQESETHHDDYQPLREPELSSED
jgi:hypothetical protein